MEGFQGAPGSALFLNLKLFGRVMASFEGVGLDGSQGGPAYIAAGKDHVYRMQNRIARSWWGEEEKEGGRREYPDFILQ